MPNRIVSEPSTNLDSYFRKSFTNIQPWLDKFLRHTEPQPRYHTYTCLLQETLQNVNFLEKKEKTYQYFEKIYSLQSQLFDLVAYLDHEKNYDTNFLEEGFRENFYKHSLTMLHWCISALVFQPSTNKSEHFYGDSVSESLNDPYHTNSLFRDHFIDVYTKNSEETSIIHTFDWVFGYLKFLLTPPAPEHVYFHNIDMLRSTKPIKRLKDLQGNTQDSQALANYITSEITTWDDQVVVDFMKNQLYNFQAIQHYIKENSQELYSHEKDRKENAELLWQLECYAENAESEPIRELTLALAQLQKVYQCNIPESPQHIMCGGQDENDYEWVPDTDPRWQQILHEDLSSARSRPHTRLESLVMEAKKIPAQLHSKSFHTLARAWRKKDPNYKKLGTFEQNILKARDLRLRKIARYIKKSVILRFPNNLSFDVVSGSTGTLCASIYDRTKYLDFQKHLPTNILPTQRENDICTLVKEAEKMTQAQNEFEQCCTENDKLLQALVLRKLCDSQKESINTQNTETDINLNTEYNIVKKIPDRSIVHTCEEILRKCKNTTNPIYLLLSCTIQHLKNGNAVPLSSPLNREYRNNSTQEGNEYLETLSTVGKNLGELLNEFHEKNHADQAHAVINELEALKPFIPNGSQRGIEGRLMILKPKLSKLSNDVANQDKISTLIKYMQQENGLIENHPSLLNYIKLSSTSSPLNTPQRTFRINENTHLAQESGSIISSETVLKFNANRAPTKSESHLQYANNVVEKRPIDPLTRSYFTRFEEEQLKQQGWKYGIMPTGEADYINMAHCISADQFVNNQLNDDAIRNEQNIFEPDEIDNTLLNTNSPNLGVTAQHSLQERLKIAFQEFYDTTKKESNHSLLKNLSILVHKYHNRTCIDRSVDNAYDNALNKFSSLYLILQGGNIAPQVPKFSYEIPQSLCEKLLEINIKPQGMITTNPWIVRTILLTSQYLNYKSFKHPSMFYKNAHCALAGSLEFYKKFTPETEPNSASIPYDYEQATCDGSHNTFTLTDLKEIICITNYLNEATKQYNSLSDESILDELQTTQKILKQKLTDIALCAYLHSGVDQTKLLEIEKDLFPIIGPAHSASIRHQVELYKRCLEITEFYTSIYESLTSQLNTAYFNKPGQIAIIEKFQEKMAELHDKCKNFKDNTSTPMPVKTISLTDIHNPFFKNKNIYTSFENILQEINCFLGCSFPAYPLPELDELIENLNTFQKEYNNTPRMMPKLKT
ncbi:MAG: hypothetical protein VX112_00565 [Pseudomonadota bacterium]|nr:hypothetical protein [Pseudomonadota bacterium]